MRRAATLLALLLLGAATAAASGLGDRIVAVEDGTVRLSYPVRDRVNDEHHRIHFHQGGTPVVEGRRAERVALVEVAVRDGRVRDVDLWLGERWRRDEADLDLGPVDSAEAAAWFLEVARTGSRRTADDAIHAACVARDGDIVDPLLALARDRGLHEDVREDAVMMLAVFAAEEAVEPLRALTEAEEESADMREAAVFGLSMLPSERAVPLLLDFARHHDRPEVRRTALILLGQHGGEDVLALLEDILLDE